MIPEMQTEAQQRKLAESNTILNDMMPKFLKLVAALETLVKSGLIPPDALEEADAIVRLGRVNTNDI
jgi:hypothetical protein